MAKVVKNAGRTKLNVISKPVYAVQESFVLKYWATFTSPIITGTSTKGPITAENASPEFIPNTAIATAIASSKLLLAAVKDNVAVCPYVAPALLLTKNENRNIITKYIISGIAINKTSNGNLIMYSPLSENITIMVNNRAISVIGLILGINLVLYQSLLLILIRKYLERKPAIKGIPR